MHTTLNDPKIYFLIQKKISLFRYKKILCSFTLGRDEFNHLCLFLSFENLRIYFTYIKVQFAFTMKKHIVCDLCKKWLKRLGFFLSAKNNFSTLILKGKDERVEIILFFILISRENVLNENIF